MFSPLTNMSLFHDLPTLGMATDDSHTGAVSSQVMDTLLGRRLGQRDSLPSLLMKCHRQHGKDRSMA